MSWLNNFKITFKIGLIVALMAIVMVGSTSYAPQRMRAMDDANSDIVKLSSRDSERLKAEVGRFLNTVRAA